MATLAGMAFGLTPSAAAETVLHEQAAWNRARSRIFTTRTVLTDDGRIETRRVPGGVVDGVRMVRFHLASLPGVVPYLPARTSSGNDVRWESGCVHITPDLAGSSDVAADGEGLALEAALAEWEGTTAGCGYQGFVRLPPEDHEVGYDGVNVVKYREDRWCRPPVDGDPEECYQGEAAAITTLIHIDREGASDDGRLLDADIELNGVDFAYAVDGTSLGQGAVADVQNTLAHELGHLLGLDHTCWDREGEAPLDGDGDRVPDCRPSALLSGEVVEATMYNYQLAGETSKRTLEPDDVGGACALYPRAEDPGTCEPVSGPGGGGGCGCRVGGRSGTDGRARLAALLGVAAVVGGAWSRSRRRR